MRALLCLGILLEQIFASQDFQYIQKLEGESVDIICIAQQRKSRPSRLYLRRFSHSEEIINIIEDGDIKPETERPVKITGQDSHTVTVTVLNLKYTDTGLYVCEFLQENQHDKPLDNVNVFLLVKAGGDLCSCERHSLVIYIISLAVCLLLLSIIASSAVYYKNLNAQQGPQCIIPVYEDMSRKGMRANLHQVSPQVHRQSSSFTLGQYEEYAGKSLCISEDNKSS